MAEVIDFDHESNAPLADRVKSLFI